MHIPTADRMKYFQPGIFAELAGLKRELQAAGREVIDFSIGSPNIPPAPHIRERLAELMFDSAQYVYSLRDLPALREAAGQWYERRYGVELDPEREILSLNGSQDGLVHFCLAFINPGDTVLVPDPFFPAFVVGPQLAGARIHFMPLRAENNYLIDFDAIPPQVARAAKLILVSYPNNPTAAIAPDDFYRRLIDFAQKYDIMVLHDNAYSDLIYDQEQGKSFLAFPGGKEAGVEFNSLSKTYGLPGARLGFCLGNREMCLTFNRLKTNLDLGSFLPLQYAAIAALTGGQESVAANRAAYQRRRDVLVKALRGIGWAVDPPAATLFAWAKLPPGHASSRDFVTQLLKESGVLLAPGHAFGSTGEGYVRFSLVQNEDKIIQAITNIGNSSIFNI